MNKSNNLFIYISIVFFIVLFARIYIDKKKGISIKEQFRLTPKTLIAFLIILIIFIGLLMATLLK